MQRERLSIPKIVLYILLALLLYVVQTTLFGAWSIAGYHVDVLPALVVAAALLDGPAEGMIVGIAVGPAVRSGLYRDRRAVPVVFPAVRAGGRAFSRMALSGSYVSMLLTTAFEMVLLGLLRYFAYCCRRRGASLGLVLRQVAAGTLLTCLFSFVAYFPMRRISRLFADR